MTVPRDACTPTYIRQTLESTKMTKFNTAAEARAFGAAMYAAGKCTAWCDYRSFGKVVLRVQVGGIWSNLGAV